MLPAGRHNLQLTSAAAGFQHALSVEIEPGRTITRKVAIPDGVLSVNALPWANVWLDGQALGTTPVANMAVPIGTHEVVWRHPQLGERRQSVTVTVRTPVRLVMDLTK
jgi:serine/threonine-protein kinase